MRKCLGDCGKSLEGTHLRRKRCTACQIINNRELTRVRYCKRGAVKVFNKNAVNKTVDVCPRCGKTLQIRQVELRDFVKWCDSPLCDYTANERKTKNDK